MPPRALSILEFKKAAREAMVAADAVAVEPVSTPKFPGNREKNREFCKLVAFGAAETPNRAVVAGLLMQIPYSMEQGIISAEQGILVQEQGILPTKSEIIIG